MADEIEPISEERFEAFLDATLDDVQRAQVERELVSRSDLEAEVALQRQIDAGLKRLFPPVASPTVGPASIETARFAPTNGRVHLDRRLLLGGAVLAAALAGILLAVWRPRDSRPVPFFQPMPLAAIYRNTLAGGFEPYYECTDPERFREVFRTRQDKPLELLPMPEGSRMLGLSYPGGLSRDTTAMLCVIEDRPVMVFVDRVAADTPIADDLSGDEDLHVFREVRDGLVFYEVTPFSSARASEYLVVNR